MLAVLRNNNNTSHVITTREVDGEHDEFDDEEEDVVEDNWSYQDFLSVKDMNLTRYRSSSDMRSLNTFKSAQSMGSSIDKLSLVETQITLDSSYNIQIDDRCSHIQCASSMFGFFSLHYEDQQDLKTL